MFNKLDVNMLRRSTDSKSGHYLEKILNKQQGEISHSKFLQKSKSVLFFDQRFQNKNVNQNMLNKESFKDSSNSRFAKRSGTLMNLSNPNIAKSSIDRSQVLHDMSIDLSPQNNSRIPKKGSEFRPKELNALSNRFKLPLQKIKKGGNLKTERSIQSSIKMSVKKLDEDANMIDSTQ